MKNLLINGHLIRAWPKDLVKVVALQPNLDLAGSLINIGHNPAIRIPLFLVQRSTSDDDANFLLSIFLRFHLFGEDRRKLRLFR